MNLFESNRYSDSKVDTSDVSNTFRRRFVFALLGAGALPIVGCGGGDEFSELTDVSEPDSADNRPAKSAAEAPIGVRTFSARWACTLIPEIGEMPVWTTSSGLGIPTVRDCWGLLRHARSGEARFWGARRVENKIRFSADLTNGSYWISVGSANVLALTADSSALDSTGAFRAHRLAKTSTNSARVQTVGILPAVEHTFSVYARAESLSQIFLQFYVSGGPILASRLFSIGPTGWTRIQVSGVPDGRSSYRILISPGPFVSSTPGSILICNAQLEEVSGHPNAAASEYVASDRPGAPYWYHGAMVDGVKYFDSFKGNSVSQGYVTESDGASIGSGMLQNLRLEPSATNLCPSSESFSSWNIAAGSLMVTPFAATSVRADLSATRLTETMLDGPKFVSCDLGAVPNSAPLTASCFSKADTLNWVWLGLVLSDGSVVRAFYNVLLGTTGSVVSTTNRTCWMHVEPWGNGWFRCVLTTTNSATGSTGPAMQVGISQTDDVISYVGLGSRVLVWGAHAAPTEFPPSYIPNTGTAGGIIRQSQSVEIRNASVYMIGLQNFVVKMDCFPAYYSGVTIKGGLTPAWRPLWYGYSSVPYKNQHRLGMGFRPSTVAFFGDRYLGDPNPIYYWRANHFYASGSIVIPLDTQLDNLNLRKMFVCVVSGTSGAVEPVWNPNFVYVPDTTTHITVDGTVRWQNNHDNTVQGQWEPYDTSVLNMGISNFPAAVVSGTGVATKIAPVSVLRASYFSAPGDYGYAVNGVRATLRTRPFPIDGSSNGDLHYPIESLRLARLGESASSHPLGIGNVVISSEQISAEENRLRTVLAIA